MPAAIELNQLCKSFGAGLPDAIKSISASLGKNRITGLVGPDGAGKTTLMRLMAGLLAPTQGSLRVLGVDPLQASHSLHEQLAYMPQKFGLYEDLTVLENLTLHADLRHVVGVDRQAAFQRLLTLTDLSAFTGRFAGKLSGGMKQKLGLACSLLGSPKLLLLDEPSVGVDPISRRELWKMVRDLCAKGITVVWCTSYLDEAQLCDDVMLMNQGELVAFGHPQQISASMQGRSVLVSGVQGNQRQALTRLLRAPQVTDGVIQGKKLRLVLRDAATLPDFDALDAGPNVNVQLTQPNLEDAFISLLGGGPGGESELAKVMPQVELDASVPRDGVIHAQQLSKQFGDFVATDRVTFKVQQGEIFGLLGPNGAGKSTTFKMMCGLLKPSAGQAQVMGIDLKTRAAQARQHLGYMAQKFSLYTNLTVLQNLKFFSGLYGLSGQRQTAKITQMVDVFAFSAYLKTPAGQLPLGFKQRLALACCVMHEPQLLFLDEPTSGVDPVTRREFWNHINSLTQKGVTVMVTTHFMDEAQYCDRIALVYQGRIIASGTPDALKLSVASSRRPDPSMEDAFVSLVEQANL